MNYKVVLKAKAANDLEAFMKESNAPLLKKIKQLLLELEEHPTYGTGKPEMLRGDKKGYWSRRINSKTPIILHHTQRCRNRHSDITHGALR